MIGDGGEIGTPPPPSGGQLFVFCVEKNKSAWNRLKLQEIEVGVRLERSAGDQWPEAGIADP
jgi:hypothetical protein